MENDTWGRYSPDMNMWLNTSANTISANTINTINSISGIITEPTLVLDSVSYIPMLRGSAHKRLIVSAVGLVKDPLFAKIIAPFQVGLSTVTNTYEYKFEEGQLAALMEEYFFFKEELCTS